MTLADLMASDVTGVFLNTSDFAESITHRPGGVPASDTTATVVFDQGTGNGDNRKDSSAGEARVSTATVYAAASLAVAAGDQFVRDSEVWAVTTVAPDESGMQRCMVQRVDEDRRNTRMRGMR